eukprot:3678316-Heterocapsa_arctica.AAC.1
MVTDCTLFSMCFNVFDSLSKLFDAFDLQEGPMTKAITLKKLPETHYPSGSPKTYPAPFPALLELHLPSK